MPEKNSQSDKKGDFPLFDIVQKFTVPKDGKELDLHALWLDVLNKLPDETFCDKCKDAKTVLKWGYAMRDSANEDGILFLGLNPSLISKDGKKIPDGETPPEKLEEGISHSAEYKYFRTLETVCKNLNDLNKGSDPFKHSHLDLFYVRQTSQNKLVAMMNCDKLQDFFRDQFKITKQVIFRLRPKAIVVINALVSRLFKPAIREDIYDNESDGNGTAKSLRKNKNGKEPRGNGGEESILKGLLDEFQQVWDAEMGTYVITGDSPLSGVPVFYSGMLSGQRALDVGSRNRLVWHLDYVLNKLDNKQPDNPH